jgi:phosphatidylserine/phosphatidylglycerophosphate/cardiolipin synthase-like enzyme
MVSAVPMATMIRAFGQAATIELSAYVLREGDVKAALEAAARRGARVSVTLETAPYSGGTDDLAAANRATVADLRAHRIDARLSDPAGPPLHMKAALADGVAYLDDRNWAGDGFETIVRTDDRDDVGVVARALAGTPASDGHLWTQKAAAERAEAGMIYAARTDRIDVESESFGFSPVYGALKARAKSGVHVRLIVSDREANDPRSTRERHALANLAAVGVAIRVAPRDEKLAIAGDGVWVGSANATESKSTRDQVDWGMRSRDPKLRAAIATRFEENWRSGR